MSFFDFHHHHITEANGIFNLDLFDDAVNFSFSAGIHPKNIVENNDSAFIWLNEIVKDPKCVAIGECGLDGLIKIDPDLQKEIFLRQIELANNVSKPVIIHCVKKHYELIPLKKISKTPMIIHGFNKNASVAEALLKEDFLFSFGKAVLQNVSLQEIVKNINPRKYFLETDDASFDIEELYREVAVIRSEDLETVIHQVRKNLDLIIHG